jgi:cupin fold WbuC family metalloprotein
MNVGAAETIAELLSRAAASPRKTMNLNLHAELADTTNRFLNAGIAGTHVRPHRHRIDKRELLSVVQGKFDVLTFTPDGVFKNRIVLGSKGSSVIKPGSDWHSVVFDAPAAVVLEVKAGPYDPLLDKRVCWLGAT